MKDKGTREERRDAEVDESSPRHDVLPPSYISSIFSSPGCCSLFILVEANKTGESVLPLDKAAWFIFTETSQQKKAWIESEEGEKGREQDE